MHASYPKFTAESGYRKRIDLARPTLNKKTGERHMASPVHNDKPVVLIVEDEILVRMSAVDMVEDAGFHAISASDADEAIRLLESRNDIRAMFTDIQMPGSMDGLRLARVVRSRWPPVALIVTSGRGDF